MRVITSCPLSRRHGVLVSLQLTPPFNKVASLQLHTALSEVLSPDTEIIWHRKQCVPHVGSLPHPLENFLTSFFLSLQPWAVVFRILSLCEHSIKVTSGSDFQPVSWRTKPAPTTHKMAAHWAYPLTIEPENLKRLWQFWSGWGRHNRRGLGGWCGTSPHGEHCD